MSLMLTHSSSYSRIIRVFTSALFHRSPRYHDTASRRTLPSSKMQTGYFSACMPACFRLLLMNHLVRTHSFMYTHSFFDPQELGTCVFAGAYHLFPYSSKTQMHRKWNWSAGEISPGLSSLHIIRMVLNLKNSPEMISAINLIHRHIPFLIQPGCFKVFVAA